MPSYAKSRQSWVGKLEEWCDKWRRNAGDGVEAKK